MSTAFLIVGATGKQGGALVRSLIKQPGFSPTTHTVYGVTRDIYSGSAKKLASLSPAIKPIQGQLEKPAAIFAQLDPKPVALYLVHPVDKRETTVCNAFIDEADKHGIQQIVFSSVDRGANSDTDPTDVHHFITKYHVEQHLKEKSQKSRGRLSYTILRPVFFLDNFNTGFVGRVIAAAWRDSVGKETKLQVIDCRDIGEFAALAIMNPEDEKFKNKAINLAGDELTFEQANKIWQEKTGEPLPTSYGFVATALLTVVNDMYTMFRFFREKGFGSNIAELKKIKPMISFEQFVEQEIVKK